MTDLGNAFAEAMAYTRSAWWRRYSALNSLSHHRLVRESDLAMKRSYRVQCISLDEYCAALGLAPDFIKIDAETAEPHILQGGRQTIGRHRPVVAMEVWDDSARDSRDDIAFLLDDGYRMFEYQAGAVIPHRLRDRYEYTNLLFVHPQRAQRPPRPPASEDPGAEPHHGST